MKGYLHKAYAQSLSSYGKVIHLPHSKGWILKRKIPDSKYYDGMGMYPLYVCENWDRLSEDLKVVQTDLICLSLVTDPFGKFDQNILKIEFSDVFFPYKDHFVIDLSQPLNKIISKHHQRNIKRAQNSVIVERCESPKLVSDDWVKLYQHLIKIHNIRGISAFSEKTLKRQLAVPGAKVFRGIYNNETVGMLIWYINNHIGYYHLGASSELGYRLKVSFALFWESLNYFSTVGLKWIDLGSGAGTYNNGTEGLARFKQGWSSGTRTAFFGGKIFNREKYNDISNRKMASNEKFFPIYRLGEFKSSTANEPAYRRIK